jgi:hypothetical protein
MQQSVFQLSRRLVGLLAALAGAPLGASCSDGADAVEAMPVDGGNGPAPDGAPGPADSDTGLRVLGWVRGWYITDQEAFEQGYEFSTTPLRVWTPRPEGGFDLREGPSSPSGDFVVGNLHPGPLWLQLFDRYIAGEPGKLFDLRVPVLGHPSQHWVTPGTVLELALADLAPWQRVDDLYLYSAAAGYDLHFLDQAMSTPPAMGDTSLRATINMTKHFPASALIEGLARGDELYLVQMRFTDLGDAVLWVADRSLKSSRLEMVAGAATQLTGRLAPTMPTRRRQVRWEPAVLLQRARAGFPQLMLEGARLKVSATPFNVVGLTPAGGALLASAGGDPDRLPTAFEFSDPFPMNWPRTLEYEIRFLSLLPLPGGESCEYRGTIGGATQFVGDEVAVAVTVAPPTNIEIEGQRAPTRDPVGLTPRLTWQAPPDSPRPSSYVLFVHAVDDPTPSSPRTSRLRATLYTTELEARLPPGLLEAGRSAFVVVRAVFDVGHGLSPFLTGNNSSHAEAVSAVFLP